VGDGSGTCCSLRLAGGGFVGILRAMAVCLTGRPLACFRGVLGVAWRDGLGVG
jgi:hypothetical protein